MTMLRSALIALTCFVGLLLPSNAQIIGDGIWGGQGARPLACSFSPTLWGTYNVAYTSGSPSASGGVLPYTYSETGSLPPGITLNTSTGVISGTYTTNAQNTYAGIQLKVTDAASTLVNCGASFSLDMAATLAMSYTPVTSATYNVAYTGATPSTSGGTTSYVYTSTGGALPPGMTISSSTGVISGTDSVDSGGATYAGIVVTVTDAHSRVVNSSPFTITVAAAPPAYTGIGDLSLSVTVKAYWGLQPYSSTYSGNIANICDSSTNLTCAEVTAAAGVVTYPTILGSQCNNSTNICDINILRDQSGANNCGGSACDMTYITGGGTRVRPTLVMPGAANGCPNTADPCISFNGTTQGIGTSSANFSQAQPFSVEAVSVMTGTAAFHPILFTSSLGLTFYFGGNNITARSTGNVVQLTSVDGTWYGIQAGFDGATASGSTVNANSLTQATGTLTTAAYSSNYLCIGFDCSGAYWLAGKVTEVAIFSGLFSAGDISAINTNVHSSGRWNF